MAVVFRYRQVAIASCSRAPEVHICRTSEPARIQGGAVRRHLQQSQIHRRLVDRLSRRGVRRRDQAAVRVEDRCEV
jgi:hypothetical protein